MHRTRIKFCGITRAVDAIAAANAGADAVGLIFYPGSTRCVSMVQARDILSALPPMVTPVALFVNHAVHDVISTAQALGLRSVQLHGDEPVDYLDQLQGLTVIKAIRCTLENERKLSQWQAAAGILLETAATIEPGGTGVANDWELVARFAASHRQSGDQISKLIAAGGLTAETVEAVVRRVRPWAVDVSTGIEESRGIKSETKMIAFVEAVRRADASND